MHGRLVGRVLDQVQLPAGRHSIGFATRDPGGSRMKAGVYFYRVRATGGVLTGRFVVLE